MDLNPYKVTPIDGPVQVTFAEDFRVELAYRDSTTGEILVDYTGDKSVKVSELLSSMPAEAIAQFVVELSPRMIEIAKEASQ